jgi:hypothetical protein
MSTPTITSIQYRPSTYNQDYYIVKYSHGINTLLHKEDLVVVEWLAEGNQPLPYVPPTPADHITDLQEAQEFSHNLIRTTAHSILSPTDWYITRYTETQTEVPEEITTFRSTIRTEAQTKITQVNSQETLENLKDYLRSEEYSTWTTLE